MDTTLPAESYHLQRHQENSGEYSPDGLQEALYLTINNLSLITTDEEENELAEGVHHYPLAYQIIIGVIIAFVACLTFFGNVLVVVAFVTQKKLRTFGNYFILNLAFTDLIVGILMAIYLPTLLLGTWIYGRSICTVFILFDYIVPLASSWSIAVISFDRYWCASHPTDYRLRQSPRLALAIMTIPWIAGILTFVPAEIYWQFFQQPYTVPVDKCYIAFFDHTPYLVFSSSMEFILPFIVVLVLNLLLCANIMKRSHHARRYRSPHLAQSRLRRDKNAAKSLGILVVIFGVTWGPFELCQLWNALCPSCVNGILYEVTFWMLWINSTVNPILYALLQERFRVAFKKVLCMLYCVGTKSRSKGGETGVDYSEYQTRLLINGTTQVSNRCVELEVIQDSKPHKSPAISSV